MFQSLREYMETETRLLSQVALEPVERLVTILERARAERRHIFVFGNGGSAATASHFACDLSKATVKPNLPRFPVTCLNDNMATFSAYANDMGYDMVFAEPLLSLAERGDVAIAFSASGNSPNVLQAAAVAERMGLVRVGLTGFSGGKLREGADVHIHVPSNSYGQVEDVHLAIAHAVCEMLKLEHR